MLTKEDFEKAIMWMQQSDKFLSDSADLHIDLYDTPITEGNSWLFHQLLTQNFNEEGIEVIYWWMYERNGDPTLWDIKPIPAETVDELWDYVNQFLK